MNNRDTPKKSSWLDLFSLFIFFTFVVATFIIAKLQRAKRRISRVPPHISIVRSETPKIPVQAKKTSNPSSSLSISNDNKKTDKITPPLPATFTFAVQKKVSTKNRKKLTTGEIRNKISFRQKNRVTPVRSLANKTDFADDHFIVFEQKEEVESEKPKKEPVASTPLLLTTQPVLFLNKNPFTEAKKKLIYHAEEMLQWNCVANVPFSAMGLHEFIKVMSFIFHFHRFNRAEQLLSNDMGLKRNNLRTGIYNLNCNTQLNARLISNAQLSMKSYLVEHVIELLQQHSHYSFRHHPSVSKLQSLSCSNYLPDKNSNTDELFTMFTHFNESLHMHRKTCEAINGGLFLGWMEYYIVPLINTLYEFNISDETIITSKEAKAAMKMLIIFIGDYFSEKRFENIKSIAPKLDMIDLSKLTNIIKIMELAVSLRKKLIQDIFDPHENCLDEISFWCRQLNRSILDVTKVNLFTLLRPVWFELSPDFYYASKHDLFSILKPASPLPLQFS